jgi:hypothetical protein
MQAHKKRQTRDVSRYCGVFEGLTFFLREEQYYSEDHFE